MTQKSEFPLTAIEFFNGGESVGRGLPGLGYHHVDRGLFPALLGASFFGPWLRRRPVAMGP